MERLKPNFEVSVCLPNVDENYTVHVGQDLIHASHLLEPWIKHQVLVVTDEHVAQLYLKSLQDALGKIQADVVVLPAGEQYKNQASINLIHEALAKHQHTRQTLVIALGGGVVGDVTGFAASTYLRGVDFIQIPTTLLAAVDASVGGKTAINAFGIKNAIGTFHQPKAVIIDSQTFETLLPNVYRAGFGEIIKYGLLHGGEFYQSLQTSTSIESLVASCCEIKANMVGQDPKDKTNIRALLNLGHTFAHAFEAHTHYEVLMHGEAVAIGLYCAAQLSHQRGLMSQEMVQDVDALLKHFDLPRRLPPSYAQDVEQLYTIMLKDKKRKENTVPFILMRKPGDCFIDDKVTKNEVIAALRLAIAKDFN